MKIIFERQKMTRVTYALDFNFPDNDGGYSFDCDEDGNLLPDISIGALENYQKCIDGTYDVVSQGIRKHINSWVENAIGLCNCGQEVELWDSYCSACECEKCGQWYNLSGQMLVPPEQWEEPIHDEW